jgi:hypothetical protein
MHFVGVLNSKEKYETERAFIYNVVVCCDSRSKTYRVQLPCHVVTGHRALNIMQIAPKIKKVLSIERGTKAKKYTSHASIMNFRGSTYVQYLVTSNLNTS